MARRVECRCTRCKEAYNQALDDVLAQVRSHLVYESDIGRVKRMIEKLRRS